MFKRREDLFVLETEELKSIFACTLESPFHLAKDMKTQEFPVMSQKQPPVTENCI